MEQVCRDTATYTVWVAEVGDVVGGFIARVLDEQTRIGEVQLLAVHPDCQNHGVGTALNTHALSAKRDAGMTVAQSLTGADPGHAAARRSYEKAEYTPLPIALYSQDLRG